MKKDSFNREERKITTKMDTIKERTRVKTRIKAHLIIRTISAHTAALLKVHHHLILSPMLKLTHLIPIRRTVKPLQEIPRLEYQPAENKKIALAVAPNKLQYVFGVKRGNVTRVARDRQLDNGGNCLIRAKITLISAR